MEDPLLNPGPDRTAAPQSDTSGVSDQSAPEVPAGVATVSVRAKSGAFELNGQRSGSIGPPSPMSDSGPSRSREPHTGTEAHPLSAEKLRLLTPLPSPSLGASPVASPPVTPRAADLSAPSPPLRSPRSGDFDRGAESRGGDLRSGSSSSLRGSLAQQGQRRPPTPGSAPANEFSARFQAEAQKLGGDLPNRPAKVSFRALARSPGLAAAARAELNARQHTGRITKEDGSEVQTMAHALDVERARATLEALEADVREEAGINQELLGLVEARLGGMRRSAERALGAAQALASAEAAYARALGIVARIPLAGDADSGPLRSALAAFRRLPEAVGAVHAEVQQGLAAAVKRVQLLVVHLRQECVAVSAACARAGVSADNARRQLRVAFLLHQEACRAVDQAELARSRRNSGSGQGLRFGSEAPEMDPWATEARLVAQLGRLATAQAGHRQALADAAGRLRELEARRVAALKDVVATFLSSYPPALLPEVEEQAALPGLLQRVEPEAGAAELDAAAETAQSASSQLAARQGEALEGVSQELLCSPEILRQGELAFLQQPSQAWTTCHFVLTRSRFLHWFERPDHLETLDSVRLSRCQFEAGEDSKFHITEQQGGSLPIPGLEWIYPRARRLTLRGGTVEDSCDWAIALREAMAGAAGR